MADEKPDYLKRNPLVLLGNKAVAQVETQPAKLVAPKLEIYNQDGTPHIYEAPTDEEEEAFLDMILEQLDGQDMRRAIRMVQAIEQAMQHGLFHALSAAHMLAHSPDHNQGYDEDVLCEGVDAYLDPERNISKASTITPDNVNEHVLKTFFPDKDQKPH